MSVHSDQSNCESFFFFFSFLYAVTHCGEFTSVILINDVPEAYLVCRPSLYLFNPVCVHELHAQHG